MAKLLQHGDVVFVPLPFADLTGSKVRPALVISADPQGAELILAFITSVLTNRSASSDPEFRATGLKSDSLIRLDKLVTLSRSIVARRLGTIGPATRPKVVATLRRAISV